MAKAARLAQISIDGFGGIGDAPIGLLRKHADISYPSFLVVRNVVACRPIESTF
ncbi:hypothetical protein [Caballeronia temeraria]|uniref:hypothetical protein n=1 Tax=Caballeronia temeraria TaxID=1777137 RepID=UPI000A45B24E|nr:hypothetical protein [Caballeronia temeraria]